MVYNPANESHKLDLAIHLMSNLDTAGFKRDKRFENSFGNESFREHVYSREIKSGMFVLVYTACSNHKKVYVSARAKGNDAIRISTVYIPKDKRSHSFSYKSSTKGIGKQKRVYRTGTLENIGQRMLERMRDGWRIGNNQQSCKRCHAPNFQK